MVAAAVDSIAKAVALVSNQVLVETDLNGFRIEIAIEKEACSVLGSGYHYLVRLYFLAD